MLGYLFYPNPGNTEYSSPKVIILFALCALLIVASFGISTWRKKTSNSVSRRLSKSWPGMMRIFAVIGVVLILSRAEEIQFLSMRFLWLLWLLAVIAFICFQFFKFRKMHYTIVPKEKKRDPMESYIPQPGSGKKK